MLRRRDHACGMEMSRCLTLLCSLKVLCGLCRMKVLRGLTALYGLEMLHRLVWVYGLILLYWLELLCDLNLLHGLELLCISRLLLLVIGRQAQMVVSNHICIKKERVLIHNALLHLQTQVRRWHL